MLLLPVWASVVVVVLASRLGYGYGRHMLARGVTLSGHLRLRDAPLIPLCIIGFVALYGLTAYLMPKPEVTWALPAIVDYLLAPFLWGMKLLLAAFTASAVATVALAGRHRSRRLVATLCVIVVLVIDCLMRYTHQPFLPEMKHFVRDGVIMQSTAVTCAPAACANIAKALGVEMTEREMAEVLHTNWNGTTAAQVLYGMRSLGFDAQKKTVPSRDPRELSPPAQLLLYHGDRPDGHAVALMGFEGDMCVIANPNAGIQRYNVDTLREMWRGHAIEIWRADPGE